MKFNSAGSSKDHNMRSVWQMTTHCVALCAIAILTGTENPVFKQLDKAAPKKKQQSKAKP